ncbi:MAG: ABC transporter ATP-binding protein [Desulfobacter sp.]|nr:ABC transporter ATP-binding protein [Desulfobacter sp.]WDP87860.1 MAG: ABC transporter ATP-binding protein [Desulfobacter sp.]
MFASKEKKIRLADLALVKGLTPYVRPYAWMLALTTLMVFLVTGFELLLPLLTQKAVDGFILPVQGTGTQVFGFEITQFSSFGLLFAGVIVSGFILDFCQTLFMEYTGQKIILNLRCRLFAHMTGLPVAYYDQNSSGRLVARVAGDIENMNEMFTSILVFIFKDLILMAGIFGVLFFINEQLTLYLSLIIPVIVLSIGYFSRILRKVFRNIRQKISEINHRFSEAIAGIKIIQTTTASDRFAKAFYALNQAHFTAAMSQIKIFAVFMPFIGFLGILSTALIIWTGSFSVASQAMTLGELVAFLTYMKLFFRPLRELSEKFNLLQNALASAERIITVLNTPRAEQENARVRLNQISRLEFKDINFSYENNRPVLQDLNFSLEKGKSLGIVGRTGSGKSSIINLITGFYTPQKGNILINTIDHRTMDIREIRNCTALVMQDPILFSGTVLENIKGSSRSDHTGLESALKKANCGFLHEKFSGLDTLLGEGGRPLSSGEKQLVCIARAFAFDPDLIIFDEATSYMDSQSEIQVHDAMKKLMAGRLSIIIAHRLSTVRDCDHILVLKQGQIVEQGSHADLAAQKGEYAMLLKKEQI